METEKPIDPSPMSGSVLREFLGMWGRRFRWWFFAQQCGRGLLWCGLLILPLMFYRARVGFPASAVIVFYGISALALAVAMTVMRRFRLQQIAGQLDLGCDVHDQIASGVDFIADPDPFKRLAVRKAEEWLTLHAAEIRGMWRWSKDALFAPLGVLLLWAVWWLSPWPKSVPSQRKSQPSRLADCRPFLKRPHLKRSPARHMQQ